MGLKIVNLDKGNQPYSYPYWQDPRYYYVKYDELSDHISKNIYSIIISAYSLYDKFLNGSSQKGIVIDFFQYMF
jgi:hypothetical protein